MLRFFINPYIRFFFLLGILSFFVFSVSEAVGIKDRISNLVFETYIKLHPRESSGKLIFVDIDDISLSKVGQWPWPRTRLAEIITNIKSSGASVIVFDGVLAEPDRTSPENIALMLEENHPARASLEGQASHDSILANAISNAGNFVAGFSYGSNKVSPLVKRRILVKKDVKNFFLEQKGRGSLYFKTTSQFLPELQKSSAGNGSFMASAEDDAVIRRTGLLFHNGHTLYPSLILEVLRLYEKNGKEFLKVAATKDYNNYKIQEPVTISVGQYDVPTDAEGKMWVYFRNFQKSEDISAYKFLDRHYGQEKMQDLTGKVIFIASSAEGLMDMRATPMGMRPGVRVHMNAFEQILQQQFLIRPYTANDLEIGGTVAISILLILLSFFVNPVWLVFITFFAGGSAFAGSWYMFTEYGGLFDPVTPTILVILTFVISIVMSFLKTEYEKRQVSDAFGHYISLEFMEELTKDPDKLKLGGEIRDLTVLFSDIRSFTTISEGLTPEELIQLMNDFLTPMSNLVMDNRGTIDKYMGDAMMAFWNAPLDVKDHELHACIAALKMQDALEPINEVIKDKAEKLGKKPVFLQAGIGINTGPCAVGNMGSKQRFAYSALGDDVNLASRLEGQTKTYGVNILIGESTFKKVPEFAALEVDLLKVKGKNKSVRVFALLGNNEMGSSEEFQAWKKKHNAMIDAYRGKEFEKAQKLANECKALDISFLDITYDIYINRAEEMIENPPEDNWDGAFEALSK
ncbi:MAG: adenylate/guanylate cyclase domain-containing protein [Alphaproteobacteria bacterium]|nr:adenylate/guanylate cyclase domain-containing protein [Alphaproteobacteria bacterium]